MITVKILKDNILVKEFIELPKEEKISLIKEVELPILEYKNCKIEDLPDHYKDLFIDVENKIENIAKIPSQEPKNVWIDDLPENIKNYLNEKKRPPYIHQKEVLDYIREGENVIITTPTASGKSMAFNIPVMETLYQDENARALYIYPTKALSHDQLSNLKTLEKDIGINFRPESYDGDTKDHKTKYNIRKTSRIVLTNMYELHLILWWHFKWCSFFSNLKYVIIDEAHMYRGVFGSNVAYLIRRLRRIARYYGSDPQFIVSSATLANAEEFCEKLVGKKFKMVTDDGSTKGEKYIVFYNPGTKEDDSHKREVRKLISSLVQKEKQTLCFARTRYETEAIFSNVKSDLENKKDKTLLKKVDAYKAGYEKKNKDKVIKKLKDKKLMCVISTNALEVGMDIGSLDAVIISSYPGTMTSTWQQAGRAGRGKKDESSLVVIVASKNPLDQYIITNPEFFFYRSNENAIIDMENPQIISNHLICAASELPLDKDDFRNFSKTFNSELERLKKNNDLIKGNFGWEYKLSDDNPAMTHGLKNILQEYTVLYNGKEKWKEKIDAVEAFRKLFKGANHKHKGDDYVVSDYNLDEKEIIVIKKEKNLGTIVVRETAINIKNKLMKKKIEKLNCFYGDLEIKEELYEMRKNQGITTKSKLEGPPFKFNSKGMWFEISDSSITALKNKYKNDFIVEESITGVLRSLLAIFPFYVMCDPCDVRGYTDDTSKIFIYDAHEGGIGLSKKGIEIFPEIVKETYKLVTNCSCKKGCASCIYSRPCGIVHKNLSKKGTIFLLERILEELKVEKPLNKFEIPLNEFMKYIRNDLEIQAMDVIKKKLENKSVDIKLALQYAVIQDLLGNLREAKLAYLVILNPEYDLNTYLNEILNALVKLGLYEKVIKIITTLEDIMEISAPTIIAQAKAYEALKMTDKALNNYYRILINDSNNTEAHRKLMKLAQ